MAPKAGNGSSVVRVLAKEVGLSDARLYQIFQKHGVRGPFGDTDRPRLVKILEREGKRIGPNGSGTAQDTKQKIKDAWSRKLLPRLARLLPEGDTAAGRSKVKRILKGAGLVGRLKDDDEERALSIFQSRGISTEKFEFAQPNGGAVVLATHPVQTTFLPAPPSPHPRVAPDIAAQHRELQKTMHVVFDILADYEREIMQAIRRGHISKFVAPLDLPIFALNKLRPTVKVM